VRINASHIRKVRDKLEEALEEVERLLEELEASRPLEAKPLTPSLTQKCAAAKTVGA
jgi:hypothetical protein